MSARAPNAVGSSDVHEVRRPHVLVANSVRLFAGAERFALDAARGLARRGYPVTFQAYPRAPLAVRARDAGLEVHPVATRADGAFWQVLPLTRWLERHRVDVVLCNYEKDLRTVGWAARLGRRRIAVIHSRECDVPLKNRPHYRYFYTRVADLIVLNSEATRRTTLGSAPWMRPERTRVLAKGIDVERYAGADGRAWRARMGVAPGQVLVGFAGQLVPRKRVRHLLEALARPELRSLPWVLGVAGEGPERSRLERTVRQLGLASRVRFLGFVEDPAPWMRAIDLLALPSAVEGFGYALIEAAAAGRPAVGLRASSVPEIVLDGQTGLLADAGDDDALAGVLCRLIQDATLRRRLGREAQARVRARFALDTMLDGLEDILEACSPRESREVGACG